MADQSGQPLPRPVSVEAIYLAALFDEVQGLRADLASARTLASSGEIMTLREPEIVIRPETPLTDEELDGLAAKISEAVKPKRAAKRKAK